MLIKYINIFVIIFQSRSVKNRKSNTPNRNNNDNTDDTLVKIPTRNCKRQQFYEQSAG